MLVITAQLKRTILTIYSGHLEKAMAPHSSTLAWKIPWMEEPGRLQSMGSLRFGHDWATSLSLFTFTHWSRKWQPTPVFLPGESLEWQSLVGCYLWGHTESDTTKVFRSSSRQHIKKQRHYFAIKGPSNQGYGFSSGHVWMCSWTTKKAEHRRIELLNCGVREDSWESLGLQGDPTSPS